MMAPARDPWWIIAGAAAALHGAAGPVGDVDVLASERDAVALLTTLGIRSATAPSDRFRSAVFACWAGTPLPIEIMAGFEVHTIEGWRPATPATRVTKMVGEVPLYGPDIPELIAHCALFGRPKDIARASLLQRLITDHGLRPRPA